MLYKMHYCIGMERLRHTAVYVNQNKERCVKKYTRLQRDSNPRPSAY